MLVWASGKLRWAETLEGCPRWDPAASPNEIAALASGYAALRVNLCFILSHSLPSVHSCSWLCMPSLCFGGGREGGKVEERRYPWLCR